MDNTGAENQTEQAVAAQAEQPAGTAQAQERTYTQKELDTMLAQAKEREEARVKGLNKVVSKKDTEIEALKKGSGEVPLSILRKMATTLDKTLAAGYGDEEATRAAKSELASINKEITQIQAAGELAKTEAIRDGMWNRIKELGLDPDPSSDGYDERLDPIVAFWQTGNIQLAQQRLDKLATKIEKEKAVETPKPVDRDKLKAEMRAEIIKELGLDKQDSGGVGGGVTSFTREQIRNMTPDEYVKNETAIRKALEAGRIK